MPKDENEVRLIIENVTNNYNINLTKNQEDKLVSLFNNMKNADVDWNRVADTAVKYKDKASKFFKFSWRRKSSRKYKEFLG